MGIVAPLVGAWIEIPVHTTVSPSSSVAPLVGAWIEISNRSCNPLVPLSLPSWERGLKLNAEVSGWYNSLVAPLVGAWIEI